MSKNKRAEATPDEMPRDAEYPPADFPDATPKPALKPRQNFAKENAELRKGIAAVLDRIDLADDPDFALADEVKMKLYQKAIEKLRGLV